MANAKPGQAVWHAPLELKWFDTKRGKGQHLDQNVWAICSVLIPTLESDPVFNEAHSACESWTVGVGAAKASKIVSNFMEGRPPSRPQIEVAIMGFVEDPGRQLALRDNGRAIIDSSIASQADIDGREELPVMSGFWVVVRQMGCPVIFVGCLVGDESSIVMGSLSTSDKRFSQYRLEISTKFYFRTPPLLGPNKPTQSIPFTWTDKDEAFEKSCSSLWNQQAAAADI
ncbi:MAG: hypothetical protein ALECFALPRED_007716 [Alectoria fallacina]|uniref:Uncharacterized protein n=1 Tax=Alectoria fallacina TaxID=1903189 RepID=A0A8H3J0Q3_9LECA|nr:MAG: hypothetical protein ALECFALPRED_007716 [Alectoria fallacina]